MSGSPISGEGIHWPSSSLLSGHLLSGHLLSHTPNIIMLPPLPSQRIAGQGTVSRSMEAGFLRMQRSEGCMISMLSAFAGRGTYPACSLCGQSLCIKPLQSPVMLAATKIGQVIGRIVGAGGPEAKKAAVRSFNKDPHLAADNPKGSVCLGHGLALSCG